jgi:hypothetical protein
LRRGQRGGCRAAAVRGRRAPAGLRTSAKVVAASHGVPA